MNRLEALFPLHDAARATHCRRSARDGAHGAASRSGAGQDIGELSISLLKMHKGMGQMMKKMGAGRKARRQGEEAGPRRALTGWKLGGG